MVVLDSNIFIYLSKGDIPKTKIAKTDIAHASVTKIEALGYPHIAANELLLLEELFNESNSIPLAEEIVDKAVRLRQARRMSLGDSIVAATAMITANELWTANTKDFKNIDGLKVHNPLKES